MPEFKDSVAAEQAEELVTTADFKSNPQVHRRRRHPIGRRNVGGGVRTSRIGPWDGASGRDAIQERLDRARAAVVDKPVELPCTKYSTEVVGKPSPYRQEDATERGHRHGESNCCGRKVYLSGKNCKCGCGKGIIRKMFAALWPFKRSRKEQVPVASGEGEGGTRQSHRQRSSGGRCFRPKNRSANQRSRSTGA
ncbi:MAG: hypothetical protein LBD72_00595 [Puniceicoccales bacterium]|jgi:hypothetical protein|nr:hypothetical protein [Puniceicoccales bacterium]